MRNLLAFVLLTSLAGTAAIAQEGESEAKWFVRPGITGISMADGLTLSLAGTPVPDTDDNTKFHVTPTIQIGRFIGDNFSIALTVGIPPTIDVDGKGPVLGPLGKLASTTYGPATLMAHYRPVKSGTVQPYLGAGLCYMIVFDADDGAFENVEIDNDIGPAFEVGADIMLTKKHGLFVEVKKAFLRTDARGTFMGAPVDARAKLDPWAFSIGGVIRF